jgi:hypothetical protein
MKITRTLLLAAIALLLFRPAQSQQRSADSLVHKLFGTLQAKNKEAFVALYPNGEQFGRFMRNIMQQALGSEEVRKAMESDEKSKNMDLDSLIDAQTAMFSSPEMFMQMQRSFGDVFQKVIDKGEQKGVRWSEAKMTGFTIDSSVAVEEGAPFQPQGLKAAKGVIQFNVGEEAYQLAFDKMFYVESEAGWFGAEFPQLARKGESLEPDSAQEVDAAPAAKPKAAPKSNAPASKKTGTTKPAPRKKS